MSPAFAQAGAIFRNDLRLMRRGSKLADFFGAAVIGGFAVLAHFAAFGLLALIRRGAQSPSLPVVAAFAWVFAFIMLGTAMNAAIGALYERADFDLLLSAPVPARAVLLARLVSITAAGFLSTVVFVPAVIDAAAFFYGPRWLAGYPVWLCLGLLAGAAGTGLMLVLVHLLGARRARVVSQVIAAGLGTSIYFAGQLPRLLEHHRWAWLDDALAALLGNPAVLLPALAARGSPGFLGILALVAAGFVALTVWLLARTFATGLQDVSAAPAVRRRIGPHRWTEGLARATFWKDLKLIARDPLLFAKTLPPMLYSTAVGGFALLRWLGWGCLAPVGFFLCWQLSSVLCSVAVAADECWDLIRMGPSPELRLRLAKLTAGVALPGTGILVVAAVLAALGRPGLGILAAATTLACSIGFGWIAVAEVRLVKRSELMQRGGRMGGMSGNTIAQIVGGIYFFCTGGAGLVLAAKGIWPWVAGSLISLAIAGAAACPAIVKLEAIVWKDE